MHVKQKTDYVMRVQYCKGKNINVAVVKNQAKTDAL